MTDEEFLKIFESQAWPLDQWHHREHIKLAYLYLMRHPFDLAVSKICSGIKAHNAAHKVAESPTSGYHETMTRAWARLVYHTICEYGAAPDADSFFEEHPELSQKKTLRLFYSRERFMSLEAKERFIEPNLAPFPKSLKPPPTLT